MNTRFAEVANCEEYIELVILLKKCGYEVASAVANQGGAYQFETQVYRRGKDVVTFFICFGSRQEAIKIEDECSMSPHDGGGI